MRITKSGARIGFTIKERLEFYSIPEPNSGCVLWTRAALEKRMGYGVLNVAKRGVVAAHRLSYEEYKGPIPVGMFVCHKCDVPACINPAHLFLGTPKDNVHDMSKKGRSKKGNAGVYGVGHGNARLNDSLVRRIRTDPRPAKDIAKEIGVSKGTVQFVRAGATWRHVT